MHDTSLYIQRLPFSLKVNTEKPVMFWESRDQVHGSMEWTTVQASHLKARIDHVRACVFRTLKILNGYFLNSSMKRAQNSDSETHVKKLNF